MNKKVILILLIIVVIIIAGFVIYRGTMFSKEILKLEILGPSSAKIGEEIEYTIVYKNNGNFVLQSPKLTFLLPENSLTEDGKLIIVKNLKDIYPGNQGSVEIKGRLLGKEGDYKNAKASLTYVPKNITATYEAETTFITKIDASPINLTFDLPTKTEKGKNLQFSINYFSNVEYPLENLSLKIDQIPGFNISSSSPASLDGSEWKLPTINKAQGGRINIVGSVSVDANQNLNFLAQLGMWQNGSFVAIKDAIAQVEVIQPLLYISQQVNGSASYVASPGETLKYQIFFTNIGSTAFDNLFLVARINGQALDLSTIQPDGGGRVQPNDNMIIWDFSQVSYLRRLDVQQQGEVSFTVKVKKDFSPSVSAREDNTIITDEVTISQITQKFSIKVSSGLIVFQKAYYKSEEIPNSGPVPPIVGKTTTYTVNWEIKDYFNDAKNVKVKAVLPKNVSLTGKIMPSTETANFSFDSKSREIVWSAGDVVAGTGVTGDPIGLSFQISFMPDISQKGSVAQIIGAVQITGENQFTNTIVSSQDNSINTSLPDDFANSAGGVVQ
jgi:uncharacterized repeat protein (TIGR01451 family)